MSARWIHVRGVGKTYPGEGGGAPVVALEDVSFAVKDGERVGIIGPNGAGKSTLLQIIAGVNPPTTGEADVRGHVSSILTVGIGVREEATGRENLYLDGAVRGVPRAEIDAHIDEMIAFADLGEFIDRPMRTYSTGMKSRLAFAALVFIEPEILIIDEALGVGDAKFATKSAAKMRELCDKGGIVLLVSHSLAAIRAMCQRAIWIDGGRIIIDGPADEVTIAYRDAVHAREQAEIARKFGAAGAAWSRRAGAAVEDLRVCVEGDAQALIEAGAQAELCGTLRGLRPGAGDALRVWIERNDGVLVLDELATVDPRLDACAVRIPLGALDWRPFVYQAHLEIVAPSGAVAHAATSFKIWSDVAITGGTPMVRTPPRITAQRIG